MMGSMDLAGGIDVGVAAYASGDDVEERSSASAPSMLKNVGDVRPGGSGGGGE